MKKEMLLKRLEKVNDNREDLFSNEALEIIKDYFDSLDDGTKIKEADLQDLPFDATDSFFIYYDAAFDYLSKNNFVDFKEAFEEGLTDVSSIADYYLSEELSDIIAILFKKKEEK